MNFPDGFLPMLLRFEYKVKRFCLNLQFNTYSLLQAYSHVFVKAIYKTLRSVIFSLTLVVVGLYVLVYTLFSLPVFTGYVIGKASGELSGFLGSELQIGELEVYPFNELKLRDVRLLDPEGQVCVTIDEIASGISVWKLILEQRIVLTYGEIIGLNANVVQKEKDAPLNIDFIFKAFAPKDKNKPKTSFDLALQNVVLRKSSLSFSRPWIHDEYLGDLDLSEIQLKNIAADIALPKLSDKRIDVDLRRLSLDIQNAIRVEKLGFKASLSPEEISLDNFVFELPASRLRFSNLNLKADESGNFVAPLYTQDFSLNIEGSYLTPADFKSLVPFLAAFSEPLALNVDLKGNLTDLSLLQFYFGKNDLFFIDLAGNFSNLTLPAEIKGSLSLFKTHAGEDFIRRIISLPVNFPDIAAKALKNLHYLDITGIADANLANKHLASNLEISSNLFQISLEGDVSHLGRNDFDGEGEVTIRNLALSDILPHLPVSDIDADIVAKGSFINNDPQGMVSLAVDNLTFKGSNFKGFSINVTKEEDVIDGDLFMHNAIADMDARIFAVINKETKKCALDLDLQRLDLSHLIDMKKYDGYLIEGLLNFDAEQIDNNNLTANLVLNNVSFSDPEDNRRLPLKHLELDANLNDDTDIIELKSDWADARAAGNFRIDALPAQFTELLANTFPDLIAPKIKKKEEVPADIELDMLIKKNPNLAQFFNLPVKLLAPANVSGSFSSSTNDASITVDIPYLQQGKDKLIYDTKLLANINGQSGVLNALVETNLPVKRGDLALNLNIFGHNNEISTDIHWINTENPDFKGHLAIDTEIIKNEFSQSPELLATIKPSLIQMGTSDWNISNSKIKYKDKTVSVDNLMIWNDDQYVLVDGVAAPDYEDEIAITLENIDVDYIFDTLQINYVTFGGVATGKITGHSLLSDNPVGETESLIIKDFSYNGCELGTCEARSRWNNTQKEIEIAADIYDGSNQVVGAAGGIWLGKDSLSFDIMARKVPVDFVQPFMAAFSSHVGGIATGDIKLFGTFHDIDMTGKIFADSVAVKLDYTNTVYHGSDSVILTPGKIDIPHFRLYDKFGNSAVMSGELTHRYFHDPSFTFRLSDANHFLCYDTNSQLNPDWYGTLYGSGSALIRGVPGNTDISADMTILGNSNFAFVLNETQYAHDYQFLTFSDRRKAEAQQAVEITPPDVKELLRRNMRQEDASVSRFGIDIRATVTPQVLFTLIMDPATGDKIAARGQGAMQVKYESDVDEMMMYGKYEILEGNYNFSLQDIILRDFKIKEGSYITFNGNPLAADLSISATYRVNTNLSDLDKSFSTDRDLNRTNVPVDAVLSVDGSLTQPDITFDIELPTLTQDVERKVKSIISTDDMMNRQIIYLLALNRFYTPEYMGSQSSGGELTAVASSTISSQLSNILGQLTDKFSVSPSFRSDKGDFSDIEVDVALSSRLLNNRLLINGNFGYRDRSNSSTTFVGDFDVEYLLSRNGNLRLKAYNHFNDQNYYLREALTTQGLGVVYRRDFDNWFTFLRKKKKTTQTDGTEN